MIRMPFTKLLIWQKGIDLADLIYDITSTFPIVETYGLTSQLRRSAVSVPSNVAEGSQRTSQKEFGNFLLIAKGSLAELFTQLIIANKRNYVREDLYEKACKQIDALDKMLHAFFNTLTKRLRSA